MSFQNVALQMMLSSYIAPEAPTVTVVAPKVVKAATKTVKVAKVEPTLPSNGGSTKGAAVATVNLPSKGTLDAEGFFSALRKAKDRNETIQAIAGYMGYDVTRDFGSQESEARMQAARDLRPITAGADRKAQRVLASSVKGYIAGLPDHSAKSLSNLQARERLAVDTMIQHERDASEAKTEQDRGVSLALAQVERERLIQIRKDLAGYGK
jgi:hypothetical protein